MTLTDLNQLEETKLKAVLTNCCGASKWVNEMAGRFPFESEDALFKLAEKIWFEHCGKADWLEAFSHHPKIGDLKSLEKKFANTRDWSGQEQAGVNLATKEVLKALAEGNKAYEEKFGYIFIVCATGKSASEMLAMLQNRLENDPKEEIHIAMQEQHKITEIRLNKLLD